MPDLDLIRKRLPAHYADCERDPSRPDVWPCTCTATADVEALVDLAKTQDRQLDQAARTVQSLVDPDGTY